MSDDTFLFWGGVVTTFLVLAALLTFRELVEQRLEEREAAKARTEDDG